MGACLTGDRAAATCWTPSSASRLRS